MAEETFRSTSPDDPDAYELAAEGPEEPAGAAEREERHAGTEPAQEQRARLREGGGSDDADESGPLRPDPPRSAGT